MAKGGAAPRDEVMIFFALAGIVGAEYVPSGAAFVEEGPTVSRLVDLSHVIVPGQEPFRFASSQWRTSD